MKNLKNVISVVTFALLINFTIYAQNDNSSSELHNEVCLEIIKNSFISGTNNFVTNQKIVNEYLTRVYLGEMTDFIKEDIASNPYSILNTYGNDISKNMNNAVNQVLKRTEGLEKDSIVKELGLIKNDINKFNLTKKEINDLHSAISIFEGSLSLWSSEEVQNLLAKKGFETGDRSNTSERVSEDDYWKVAACDFVGSFAGIWAGPLGAVGGAIIASTNSFINLW